MNYAPHILTWVLSCCFLPKVSLQALPCNACNDTEEILDRYKVHWTSLRHARSSLMAYVRSCHGVTQPIIRCNASLMTLYGGLHHAVMEAMPRRKRGHATAYERSLYAITQPLPCRHRCHATAYHVSCYSVTYVTLRGDHWRVMPYPGPSYAVIVAALCRSRGHATASLSLHYAVA